MCDICYTDSVDDKPLFECNSCHSTVCYTCFGKYINEQKITEQNIEFSCYNCDNIIRLKDIYEYYLDVNIKDFKIYVNVILKKLLNSHTPSENEQIMETIYSFSDEMKKMIETTAQFRVDVVFNDYDTGGLRLIESLKRMNYLSNLPPYNIGLTDYVENMFATLDYISSRCTCKRDIVFSKNYIENVLANRPCKCGKQYSNWPYYYKHKRMYTVEELSKLDQIEIKEALLINILIAYEKRDLDYLTNIKNYETLKVPRMMNGKMLVSPSASDSLYDKALFMYTMALDSQLKTDSFDQTLSTLIQHHRGFRNNNEEPVTQQVLPEISENTKQCPKCKEAIYKDGGCSQMFCTKCFTSFDWNTGELVTRYIHNPHHTEWLRQQRILNDGECINYLRDNYHDMLIYSLNEVMGYVEQREFMFETTLENIYTSKYAYKDIPQKIHKLLNTYVYRKVLDVYVIEIVGFVRIMLESRNTANDIEVRTFIYEEVKNFKDKVRKVNQTFGRKSFMVNLDKLKLDYNVKNESIFSSKPFVYLSDLSLHMLLNDIL